MTTHQCTQNCCTLLTKPYTRKKYRYTDQAKYKTQKAGAFIYDPVTRRILLVQSRGDKWGAPKGSMEQTDLSIEDCAIREVREETGIELEKRQLEVWYNTCRTTYYYIELPLQSVTVDTEGVINNDATGVTWIKLECLAEMVQTGTINVNIACKKLVRKFLNTNIMF